MERDNQASNSSRMTSAAQRKQAQRERERSFDIKRVEVPLSATERAMLAEGCEFRGGYDASEYIATLIRRDHARIQKIKAELGSCEFCQSPLPTGCNKKFKGRTECFHTHQARQTLLL